MALPTIYWYTKIAEYAARIWPFVASFLAFFAWSYNIVAVCIVAPMNAARQSIQAIDLAFAKAAEWQAFEWLGFANAVLPLSESCAMLSAYWTFCIAMNTFRWVKSFVPTIAN